MTMKLKKKRFLSKVYCIDERKGWEMIHDEWKGRKWQCLFRLKEKAENGGA